MRPPTFGYPPKAADRAPARAGTGWVAVIDPNECCPLHPPAWGVAAICVGVGQALAIVLENPESGRAGA